MQLGLQLERRVKSLNKGAKTDILIAGVGGQGTILTGRVIAALAIAEGLDVKTAETHGMAQRGGSVITHVRIGEKVYSPLIPAGDGDILISFEKLEALRWLPFLSPAGTVIVNTQELEPLPVLTGQIEYPDQILEEIKGKVARLIAVDALSMEPVTKNPRMVNTFLLGILARIMPYAKEKWLKVMEEEIKAKLVDINKLSFEAGWKYAAN
ncbi:MAG: indolepyruvate oxidoreductase subunit beta [Firmicutes bacterium]|nr:indolepyruvate oxidoreductase subunit beta [Bacillota bacterium]